MQAGVLRVNSEFSDSSSASPFPSSLSVSSSFPIDLEARSSPACPSRQPALSPTPISTSPCQKRFLKVSCVQLSVSVRLWIIAKQDIKSVRSVPVLSLTQLFISKIGFAHLQ